MTETWLSLDFSHLIGFFQSPVILQAILEQMFDCSAYDSSWLADISGVFGIVENAFSKYTSSFANCIAGNKILG